MSIELDQAIEVAFQLGHPERYRILRACALEQESPRTMTQQGGASLGVIAYHFRVLCEKGLIERSERRAVRGTVQNFYRATPAGRRALKGMR